MRTRTSAIILALLLAGTAFGSDAVVVHTDKSACMDGPVSQFGRYVGDWKITDESLAQDGSGCSYRSSIGARSTRFD